MVYCVQTGQQSDQLPHEQTDHNTLLHEKHFHLSNKTLTDLIQVDI